MRPEHTMDEAHRATAGQPCVCLHEVEDCSHQCPHTSMQGLLLTSETAVGGQQPQVCNQSLVSLAPLGLLEV